MLPRVSVKWTRTAVAALAEFVCVCGERREMSYMCKFRLSIAKRLPCGVSEYKRSNVRHSFTTAGCSDVTNWTRDSLLTGHVINIFWFSSETKEKRDCLRTRSPHWTQFLPRAWDGLWEAVKKKKIKDAQ